MTVKDLIEELTTFPPETEIDDGHCPCEDLHVYLIAGKLYLKRGYEAGINGN